MTSIFSKYHDESYRLDIPVPGLNIGVIGKTANGINYHRDRETIRREEKNLLASFTGMSSQNIIFLDQVHGDGIIIIDAYPEEDLITLGEADGMITPLAGLCLTIRTADCVPVFAYDPVNKIIGAAHSGWRGTRQSISAKLVLKMKDLYGSNTGDIRIFILPSIGPESYTVNDDVARNFTGHVAEKNDRLYLNLWSCIEESLEGAGVPKKNIFNTRICNYNEGDEYFSHRKGDSERNLNFGFFS